MMPFQVIGMAWAVFALYWLASSFNTNRTARAESAFGIGRRILMGVAAWYFFFGVYRLRTAGLYDRFVPDTLWIAWLGAGMTVAGVAFAIWARYHIGRYWSANVVLKEGHQLIRTGPYSRIRHPIYTGMLFALLGSAITFGRIGGLAALATWTLLFWSKARKEEALLAGQFGAAFEEHRRHTGFFLPRLFTPSDPAPAAPGR